MADINGILDTNIDTKVDTTMVDVKVDESNKDTKVETKVEDKKFLQMTQEDLDELITKRLERASKKANEEKAEAERLASMSTEERFKAEFDKEKATFEEERKQYQKEKLELQVVKEMSTKGLPTSFSKYLIGDTAEVCMSNIKDFELQWTQSIASAVDGKLRGTTPKVGGSAVPTFTKEDIAKMTTEEINANWSEISKIMK